MGQFIYPSPVSYAEVDFSWMVGRRISEVSLLEPCAWRFCFGTSEYIAVFCLWRIIRDGRVIRTCQDHGHPFGLPAAVDAVQEASSLLSRTAVSAVQLREATADILVDFSADLRLEIIPDSSGYESWQVYAPHGRRFVVQGGGQICTWTENV
jgi:hypothetical protein